MVIIIIIIIIGLVGFVVVEKLMKAKERNKWS